MGSRPNNLGTTYILLNFIKLWHNTYSANNIINRPDEYVHFLKLTFSQVNLISDLTIKNTCDTITL